MDELNFDEVKFVIGVLASSTLTFLDLRFSFTMNHLLITSLPRNEQSSSIVRTDAPAQIPSTPPIPDQ